MLAIVAVLDEKLAADIRAYDIARASNLADYMVVSTCTSAPHLKALSGELAKRLKDMGETGVRVCGDSESGWIVIDAFDVIVHLFVKEARDYYRVEELWPDASVAYPEPVAEPAAEPVKPAKKSAAKKSATKTTAAKKTAAKKTAAKKPAARKPRATRAAKESE